MPTIIYHHCTRCNQPKTPNTAHLCSKCATQAIRQQNHNRIKQPANVTRYHTTGKAWKDE